MAAGHPRHLLVVPLISTFRVGNGITLPIYLAHGVQNTGKSHQRLGRLLPAVSHCVLAHAICALAQLAGSAVLNNSRDGAAECARRHGIRANVGQVNLKAAHGR